ncbi:MAG: SDR family oxidoreductase [Cohaesibacteraceae bacterium]|nr:SDR family oxidoreductase [Cohaesibacteraceae bacterium]
MDYHLNNKSALVMGASKGLGFAIATALSGEGAKIAIMSRSKDRIETAAKEIGASGIAADLSDTDSLKQGLEDTRQQIGNPDIVVINTGGPPKANFLETTQGDWATQTNSLLNATIETIRFVLPSMQQKKWGRILIVTSIAAQEPQPGLTYSNVLRAGLHGLVNDLSRQFAGDGITINAIMPGIIATDRVTDLNMKIENFRDKIPAQRFGKPEEFASLACYLASQNASYLTGQAIAVDGGYLQGI